MFLAANVNTAELYLEPAGVDPEGRLVIGPHPILGHFFPCEPRLQTRKTNPLFGSYWSYFV